MALSRPGFCLHPPSSCSVCRGPAWRRHGRPQGGREEEATVGSTSLLDTTPQPALTSMPGPGGHGWPRASAHRCSRCVLGSRCPRRLPVLLDAPDQSGARAGRALTIESVCQSGQVGKLSPERGAAVCPEPHTHRQQDPAPRPRRASPQPLLGSVPWRGCLAVCACPPGSSLSRPGSGVSGSPCARRPGSQQTARRSRICTCPGLRSGVTPVAWERARLPSQRELSGASVSAKGGKTSPHGRAAGRMLPLVP